MPKCSQCGLPTSLWDADDDDLPFAYCDGPNDSTDQDGCFGHTALYQKGN